MGSPTVEIGGGSTVVLPPTSSSAQGPDPVADRDAAGAVVPPDGHTAVEGGGGVEEQEKERVGAGGDRSEMVGGDVGDRSEVVRGDDGGDPAVSSGGGGSGDVGESGIGGGDDVERGDGDGGDKSGGVGRSSGGVGGSGGGDGVDRVKVHDVDSDSSEETIEERGTGSGSGRDQAEGTSGVIRTRAPRWRVEPRPSQRPSGGDRGKAVVTDGEAVEERPSGEVPAQGPIGISREDYLEHAPQEAVMAAAADALGILDLAREAIVESREREAELLRGAADEDAVARAFWEEFETEEAAEEARL